MKIIFRKDLQTSSQRFRTITWPKNEVTSSKSTIAMNLPFQIGAAVYRLAKLRMSRFYLKFIDKFVNRLDSLSTEMDTGSVTVAVFCFFRRYLEKLIKSHMKEEYEITI